MDIQPRHNNGQFRPKWQKFVSHTRTAAVTALIFVGIGLYLAYHAETEANKKTLELKDTQIQQLQEQVKELQAGK